MSGLPIQASPAGPLEPGEQEKIEKAVGMIQGITPGKETASRIEVISPRRARPAARPLGAVQRSIEPEQPAQNPQSRQEQPVGGSMVQTEIGPLPADLWPLVGEPQPPATQAGPGPAVQLSAAEPGEEPLEGAASLSPVRRSAFDFSGGRA